MFRGGGNGLSCLKLKRRRSVGATGARTRDLLEPRGCPMRFGWEALADRAKTGRNARDGRGRYGFVV